MSGHHGGVCVGGYEARDGSEVTVGDGERVEVLDIDRGGWAEVQYASKQGWIPLARLKLDKNTEMRFKSCLPDDHIEEPSIVGDFSENKRKISLFLAVRRPSSDLLDANILHENPSICSPRINEAQRELEKRDKKRVLDKFLGRKSGTKSSKKGSKREKGFHSFGCRLERLVDASLADERLGYDGLIPFPVFQLVTHLRTGTHLQREGIFRISGNHEKVEKLKGKFKAGTERVDLRKYDVNDVCECLKLYFRSLPEPLVPFCAYDDFVRLLRTHRGPGRRQAILSFLVGQMGPEAYHLLRFMCRFLEEVAAEESHNKMGVNNLALVFGPMWANPQIQTLENVRDNQLIVDGFIVVLQPAKPALAPVVPHRRPADE